MILRQILNQAAASLTAAKVDAPRLSAQILAAHALQCSKLDLALRAEESISAREVAHFETLVQRRAQGEPIAYILGHKEFYSRNFKVTPDTLIPRPETEEMVEAALLHCTAPQALLADLGTGSGCIAVTLAAERPQWRGYMLDISAPALRVAAHNARRYRVADRLLCVRGDLTCPPLPEERFDLIISNPPYISGEEFRHLSHEVRDFEPHSALTPDPSGLTHLRALARHAPHLLKKGGLCFVEHGHRQGQAAREIFLSAYAWAEIRTCNDLAGLERFCLCRK